MKALVTRPPVVSPLGRRAAELEAGVVPRMGWIVFTRLVWEGIHGL